MGILRAEKSDISLSRTISQQVDWNFCMTPRKNSSSSSIFLHEVLQHEETVVHDII